MHILLRTNACNPRSAASDLVSNWNVWHTHHPDAPPSDQIVIDTYDSVVGLREKLIS